MLALFVAGHNRMHASCHVVACLQIVFVYLQSVFVSQSHACSHNHVCKLYLCICKVYLCHNRMHALIIMSAQCGHPPTQLRCAATHWDHHVGCFYTFTPKAFFHCIALLTRYLSKSGQKIFNQFWLDSTALNISFKADKCIIQAYWY